VFLEVVVGVDRGHMLASISKHLNFWIWVN
jgi:hypothetical protein